MTIAFVILLITHSMTIAIFITFPVTKATASVTSFKVALLANFNTPFFVDFFWLNLILVSEHIIEFNLILI